MAAELRPTDEQKPRGPAPVPVTLSVNGEKRSFSIEPRNTLVEILRMHAGVTGPKEACDRGTCGACTVLLDGLPVYACMILAIEAEGREITTVEGISRSGLSAIQRAIVEYDGLQCGFCTPGFVTSLTALLKANPHPTEQEIQNACSGHLCRCGSYPGIFAAARACSARGDTNPLEFTSPNHGLADR